MTLTEAQRIYWSVAGRDNDYSEKEWEEIRMEMKAVVAARSDRAAANVIRWWNCWDRTFTATAFARRVRQEASKSQV